MTTTPFPLIPGQPDVEFRFTLSATRQLERAAGMGVQKLIADSRIADAVVLMTCYGLKHIDPRMTEQKAEDLITLFVEAGGDTNDLFKALFAAFQASGVFGKAETGSGPLDQKRTPTAGAVTTTV